MMVGFHIPLLLLAGLLPVSFGFDGYDFVLETNPNTPRALLTKPGGVRFSELPKTEFTFCFYLYLEKIEDEDSVTVVSYASKETGSDNELYLEIYLGRNAYTALSIGGEAAVFNKTPFLKDWTHICASWKSNTGDVHLFFDGKEIQGDGTKVQLSNSIGGNGCFVLGEDQDSCDGGYDATQGTKGRLTQFHLWARELNAAEVKEVMLNKRSGEVIAWANSTWALGGSITVEKTKAPVYTECGKVNTLPCKHVTTTNLSPYDLAGDVENGYPKEVSGTLKNVIIPNMKEFSFCFALIHNVLGYMCQPVTYKSAEGDSIITFGNENTRKIFYFGVGNEARHIPNFYLDADLNAVFCETWSSTTGDLNIYVFGQLYTKFANVSKGYVVPGNGKFIMTQDQFAPLNKENPTEGFECKTSDFSMWTRELTGEEIKNYATCTGSVKGSLVDPSTSQFDVDYRCLPHSLRSPIELEKPEDFNDNAMKKIKVSIDPMSLQIEQKLKEHTLCVWVYSKDENPDIETFVIGGASSISVNKGLQFKFDASLIKFDEYSIGAESWQHICLAWSGEKGGAIQLFVDGKKIRSVEGFADGEYINLNSIWSIQNYQYAPANEEDPTEGFFWKVTDLNLWSRILSDEEVSRAYECSLVMGDIYNPKTTVWEAV